MASVWRAVDQVLGRPVAVKVLAPRLMADHDFLQRFRVEARAAARLTHPHITSVFDYGERDLPGGELVAFIVMELLDGESLAARLQRGPLPWREAVAVCAQVAQALAAAHRRGVVHRDVKPGNVVLTQAGAKVLDFGIAAMAGEEALTSSGGVLGTAAYVAPELLAGELVTPAADVYGLGTVLLEALTGGARSADGAEEAVVALAEVHDLPPTILPLIRRCLARWPAERPSSAEVAKRLRAALGMDSPHGGALLPASASDTALLPAQGGGDPAAATRAGPARPPGSAPPAGPVRHYRRAWLVGGALVAAALVGAIVAATALRPAQRPPAAGAGKTTTTAPVAVSSTSTATSSVPSRPPAARPLDALQEVRRNVEDGVAAGEIRADVGTDLNHLISDLEERLVDGRRGGLKRRVDELRHKLDERVREGAISPTRAQVLFQAVSVLAQSLAAR